jgi:hypothetical protein
MEHGGACESVAATCSSKLMSIANSGNYAELSRVAARLYSEDTTLFRDLNLAIRENDDNDESETSALRCHVLSLQTKEDR